MIDLWPLIGIAIITVGMAFKINTLLVILTAGMVTGWVAKMPIMEVLSILGQSFTQNRYMSLFILILPMIGLLERSRFAPTRGATYRRDEKSLDNENINDLFIAAKDQQRDGPEHWWAPFDDKAAHRPNE